MAIAMAALGNRGARNLLVVAEVGLAMLLVVGAGLMLRSFNLLNAVDPGFRPERLLTFRMVVSSRASTFEHVIARRAALVAQMLDRIRALPGVVSASSIHLLPMTGGNSGTWYYRTDRPAPPPASGGGDVSIVSDGYFHTMGIPIAAGREFDLHDRAGSPGVGVLNQTAAQQIFPGENPLGKRLRVAWGQGPNEVEIVGISADIHHRGLDTKAEPCLFMPQAQQPSAYVSLLVRTAADPVSLIPAVKEQIHSAYPSQGIQDIQTMDEVVSNSVARPKLDATIMGVFGALALTLACLGIYAVISYSVEQRMREMGIRLALGAAPAGILAMVLREGMALAAGGIVVGIGASLGLTRLSFQPALRGETSRPGGIRGRYHGAGARGRGGLLLPRAARHPRGPCDGAEGGIGAAALACCGLRSPTRCDDSIVGHGRKPRTNLPRLGGGALHQYAVGGSAPWRGFHHLWWPGAQVGNLRPIGNRPAGSACRIQGSAAFSNC